MELYLFGIESATILNMRLEIENENGEWILDVNNIDDAVDLEM